VPSKVPTYHGPMRPPARPLYERMPSRREDKAFYKSPAWRKLRAMFLAASPLCLDCLAKGLLTAAIEVHHKIARKLRPDLALDWDNLMGLCKSCHSKRKGK
jgi:5-methylcytosine-specific restriction endonuclease McrA